MAKPWEDWKDNELVEEAQQGLRGQGALAEMMRRLKNSTNILSWIMVALAVLQIVLTFQNPKIQTPYVTVWVLINNKCPVSVRELSPSELHRSPGDG